MRKAFNVNLRRYGASREGRVELMRHTPDNVTDDHYDDRDLERMREAVNLIPVEAAKVPGLFEGGEMKTLQTRPNTRPNPAPSGRRCAPLGAAQERRRQRGRECARSARALLYASLRTPGAAPCRWA